MKKLKEATKKVFFKKKKITTNSSIKTNQRVLTAEGLRRKIKKNINN